METTTNVLSAVLDVFSQVGTWFGEAISDMTPIFYANNELTLIGVLCVAGLAISVIMLILAMIRSYMRFQ